MPVNQLARLCSPRRHLLQLFASVMFVSRAAAAPSSTTDVLVIPSIHKLLTGNPRYDYDDLYSLVTAFQPSLVGVEIRQEDLPCPDAYLRHNYPQEMVVLARKYGSQAFGFDWLGSDVEGRPIPDDWWTKQSPIKRLERAWNTTPPILPPEQARLNAQMDALSSQQDEIIATATAASLANGNYDRVTAAYYRTMAELMRGTPFEVLPSWYGERNQRICANIVRQVLGHPGCRIAIVTGCDHHGPVIDALSKLGPQVALIPVR